MAGLLQLPPQAAPQARAATAKPNPFRPVAPPRQPQMQRPVQPQMQRPVQPQMRMGPNAGAAPAPMATRLMQPQQMRGARRPGQPIAPDENPALRAPSAPLEASSPEKIAALNRQALDATRMQAPLVNTGSFVVR